MSVVVYSFWKKNFYFSVLANFVLFRLSVSAQDNNYCSVRPTPVLQRVVAGFHGEVRTSPGLGIGWT